jgi:iron(III) transport system substrate-binding protein
MSFPRIAARIGIVIAGMFVAVAGCKQNASAPKVVVYCSVDQEVAEPILAAFEKTSGVKVLARYDTEAGKTVGLVQKLRAEVARPAADVFWSGEIFYTIRLAEENLLEPYHSETTKTWPEKFSDPSGRWYGLGLRGRAIAYHTRRVSEADAPKSLEDLLDAKWKGRIVMARPSRGTTGGDVASWFVEYGPDAATKILKALKANEIRLVEGNSVVVRMVGAGQADIGLTDTDDVHAGIRNGWPVKMNPLARNGKGTLAIPNTVAKIRRGPNPDAADPLIDFLLGGECEQMLLAGDSHNWPVGFSPDASHKIFAIGDPAEINYAAVSAAMPDALKAVEEIFD